MKGRSIACGAMWGIMGLLVTSSAFAQYPPPQSRSGEKLSRARRL